MTAHVLPLVLDPLIAEAKRRARQRRMLVLGLILVAVAAGTALALRGSGDGSGPPTAATGHGLATAQLGQAALTYPASWKRVAWNCWTGPTNLLLLTTARPTPTCGSTLPPPEKLGRDGVAAWLETVPPLAGSMSRTLIRDPSAMTGLWPSEKRATCASGAGRRFGARVHVGRLDLLLGAVVCGPDYAQGKRALQRMVSTAVLGNVTRTRG